MAISSLHCVVSIIYLHFAKQKNLKFCMPVYIYNLGDGFISDLTVAVELSMIYWILGVIVFSMGLIYLIGIKTIEIYGRKNRRVTVLFALLLIIISILPVYSSVLDCLYQDFQERNITVTEINNPNLYHRGEFEVGKRYTIKYLRRTKLILQAIQLN